MVVARIFAESMALSLLLVLPLGMKWKFGLRTSLPMAVLIGGLTGVATLAGLKLRPDFAGFPLLLFQAAVTLFSLAGIILLRFYRDPERIPRTTKGVILSPADGRIIYVKEIEAGRIPVTVKGTREFSLRDLTRVDILETGGYLFGIEMTLLDIHVNRAPVTGRIVLQRKINGSFSSLRRPTAEFLNSRLVSVIDTGAFKVGIVQIASRLVRAIIAYVREGEVVECGQRFGMIRFGSQVDVFVPRRKEICPAARAGDRVRAGITVLARF